MITKPPRSSFSLSFLSSPPPKIRSKSSKSHFLKKLRKWSFHPLIYINLPVGIIALAALLIFLPANISERDTNYTGWASVRRIDFPGALLAAGATICLLLGLTWGGNQMYDWVSPQIIGALVASVVLYASFFVRERFAAEPILPLELFRNRVFTVASLLSLLQMMILLGMALWI